MSNGGEFFTRFTIWITIALYFVGVVLWSLSRNIRSREQAARIVWTVACISLFAHVACAFHVYHQWSHALAYKETARQTAEVVGIDWGGGLYINYALMACWVADVVWWWQGHEAYRRRPRVLVAFWQGFLLFMFFNAAVVFRTGVLRYVALFLCCGLCLLWWYSAASHSKRDDDMKTVTKN
jgi:hypothetical protein